MKDRIALRHLPWIAFLVILAVTNASCLGCQNAPAPTPASLRAQFSERAARVLDGDLPFVATPRGFSLPATERAFRLTLPREGSSPFRFEDGDFAIDVTEIGLTGAGTIDSSAVTYPREGGASYWTATEAGYEEWLHLEEGVATGRAPVATWEIRGAELRDAEGTIEIVDEDGLPRVRVTAPSAWAEDGRALTPVLQAKGTTIELWVDAGGDAVLVDPAWIAAGSMSYARGSHAQVLLLNGKVLACGGSTGAAAIKTAEVYDPAVNTWSLAGTMSVTRRSHTATLLPTGKVLVTGGDDGAAILASTEIYDPGANTWSLGPPMSNKRVQHTATLLQTGKVLVVGGYDDVSELKTAELYDPIANTWSPAATAIAARYGHTATLLQNGKVLLAGGGDFSVYFSSAELYDPIANTWSAAGTLTGGARDRHTAVLLPNSKVLVAGGSNATVLNTATLYDPATNTWTAAPAMTGARRSHAAALLPTGQVLEIGGFNAAALNTVQQYDPVANTWSALPNLLAARAAHAATTLQTGIVLATGGQSGAAALQTVERYVSGNSTIGTPCASAVSCLSGFCIDGFCCNNPCNAGPCDACSLAGGAVANGTCTLLTGPSCNDGDACTQTDTCQNGSCTGSNPLVCTAQDQCHDPGTCSPATGACSNPNKADGAACDDGDACTQTDACNTGACLGANPIVCAPLDPCHDAGSCDPATGTCSTPSKPDGAPCDDADACTQTDSCVSGACVGNNPVVCAPMDDCHDPGACDPATGTCDSPEKPDGTVCDDADACTQTDTCAAGLCTGDNPVVCAPLDDCHEAGACDPATGACDSPEKPDGTVCDDGDPCSITALCVMGVCTASAPVVCQPPDECHDAGVCNPETGGCEDIEKPDGTPCQSDEPCTDPGVCQAGVCHSGAPVQCEPIGECWTTTGCSPVTGSCIQELKPDGTPCSTGVCSTGHCEPEGTGDESDSGGCGCRTAGADPADPPAWLALSVLVLALRRRRDRQSAQSVS